MREYQIYGFGDDDTVLTNGALEAERDVDVIRAIRCTRRSSRTEIWCGERRVRRLPANLRG